MSAENMASILEENGGRSDQKELKLQKADIYFAEETSPSIVAERIANGEIGALDWGDPDNMIFVIVGKAEKKYPDVTQRMNSVKGRPDTQVLAIAGFPEIALSFAKVENSPFLNEREKITGKSKLEILEELFKHPVAVILEANDNAPDSVIGTAENGEKTIMIAGQTYNPASESYEDFYNLLAWDLASKYGLVMAGTSANLEHEPTYTIHDQERLYEALGTHLDFVVMRKNRPLKISDSMVSCTVWDLTGKIPVLKRWGSENPESFRNILGNFFVPDEVNKIPKAS